MLEASIIHTGASFAAINVLDDHGHSIDFHYTGMSSTVWDALRRGPSSVGVLAQIPDEGVLVIEEITHHPSYAGLPPEHPKLGAFLGTALRVRGRVFGWLYLANKDGGFTQRDQDVALA